jgi:hypothetical protein
VPGRIDAEQAHAAGVVVRMGDGCAALAQVLAAGGLD